MALKKSKEPERCCCCLSCPPAPSCSHGALQTWRQQP